MTKLGVFNVGKICHKVIIRSYFHFRISAVFFCCCSLSLSPNVEDLTQQNHHITTSKIITVYLITALWTVAHCNLDVLIIFIQGFFLNFVIKFVKKNQVPIFLGIRPLYSCMCVCVCERGRCLVCVCTCMFVFMRVPLFMLNTHTYTQVRAYTHTLTSTHSHPHQKHMDIYTDAYAHWHTQKQTRTDKQLQWEHKHTDRQTHIRIHTHARTLPITNYVISLSTQAICVL